MYIPANNYMTDGLRVNFIHSLHNDKGYDVKKLRKIDDRLARDYTQTQLYGGSLKSFWQKVKKIGKKVIQAPAQIASKIYPHMKKGIDFLAKNETASNIIKSIPKVGPAIDMGVKSLSKITDSVDNIIKSIREKNPSVAFNEAKNIVTDIKDTVKNVSDKVEMSDETRKKIKDNTDKVYNALPSLIKSEGLEKVQKAAGYLPFLDTATMKITERTGKSGGALKPRIRFTKPIMITRHPEFFKAWAPYNPETVGALGGAVYGRRIKSKDSKESKESETCGRTALSGKESGRTTLSGKESGRAGKRKDSPESKESRKEDDNVDDFIKSIRSKISVKKHK